jgi:hypothetical protein
VSRYGAMLIVSGKLTWLGLGARIWGEGWGWG